MNPLATRSAVVAALLVFAQTGPSWISNTEVLAQGLPAPANEVGARDAPSAGTRASSGGMRRDVQVHLQRNCPMLVEDVDVEANLTGTGATLSFTTGTGDVAELRRRVRHLGEVYGTYAGEIEMDWIRAPAPTTRASEQAMDEILAWGGASPWPMPVVSVAIVDLEAGARIFFVPTRPEDLASVRDHTAIHQKHLAAGQCWIPKAPSLMPLVAAGPIDEANGDGVGSQQSPNLERR